MAEPTVEEVRSWSKVDWAGLDYGEDDPDPLEVLLTRAVEYVENMTGRDFDDDVAPFTATLQEAVQRRVEQLAFKSQEEQAETEADFELIQQFSAGSYSETRRGMDEYLKSRLVNPWPHLHDLLWAAMTDDRREEWLEAAGLGNQPWFEVTEVDWDDPWPHLPPPPVRPDDTWGA